MELFFLNSTSSIAKVGTSSRMARRSAFTKAGVVPRMSSLAVSPSLLFSKRETSILDPPAALAALLPASVMGERRDILDDADPEAHTREGPDRGLRSWSRVVRPVVAARRLNLDVQGSDALVADDFARLLRRDHRRCRRAFHPVRLHDLPAGRAGHALCPGNVCHMDDRVIIRGIDVRNPPSQFIHASTFVSTGASAVSTFGASVFVSAAFLSASFCAFEIFGFFSAFRSGCSGSESLDAGRKEIAPSSLRLTR